MNAAAILKRIKAYLDPWRLRRLGWRGLPLLAEVAYSYYVYSRLEAEPLPEALDRFSNTRRKPGIDPGEAVRVTDWFLHPIHGPSRCMPRTVILLRLLRRRGVNATAVFGVAKEGEGLQGHAWILLDGEPLAEHDDPRTKYVETYRFPMDSEKWTMDNGQRTVDNGARREQIHG